MQLLADVAVPKNLQTCHDVHESQVSSRREECAQALSDLQSQRLHTPVPATTSAG